MKLSDIIRPEHSVIGLPATTKCHAIEGLADAAATAFILEADAIVEALRSRENLGSTACGNGIAIPHAAIEGLDRPRGLLVRFARRLDFEAVDDLPVDIAVLLLFGEAHRGEYLNVLSTIARQLRSEDVLRMMRSAKTADELYVAFVQDVT